MSRRLDISGERYGRLTAVRWIGPIFRDSLWLFTCDCGAAHEAMLGKVRSGHTKSCGCLQRDTASKAHLTHGESGTGSRQGSSTRLYRIWRRMINRCEDPANNRYARYGGRGITVCREWRENYTAFRDWAQAAGYADALSIDREDNDIGYTPSNCRWATPKQQAANRGGQFAGRVAL